MKGSYIQDYNVSFLPEDMRSTNIKIEVIATIVVTLQAMANTRNGVAFVDFYL
jgi:hypothetical protein